MSRKSIQGFKVLSLSFSNESTSHHDLFIKEHNIRTFDESKPPGRTLFVINIPPYINEDSLNRIFSSVAKVKSLVIEDSLNNNEKSGFKIAYVVFEKREGLLKALKSDQLNPVSSNDNGISLGLNKWIREYNSNIYNHENLREQVNTLIKMNDQMEDSKSTEKVDDEGWTVVTKRGRNPSISRKESVENKIITKDKVKTRKKELKNFYTFQVKEQKMKNIIALRKSFQESKEKVNLMKQMRKFKPY